MLIKHLRVQQTRFFETCKITHNLHLTPRVHTSANNITVIKISNHNTKTSQLPKSHKAKPPNWFLSLN